MGEIRIKSGNLFDVNGEHTSVKWDGKECLVIENDAIIVNQIRPGFMTGIYYDKEYKEGTYTLIIQVDSFQFINKQVRMVSSAPFLGGAWNASYKSYTADMNKQDALHYISFTVNEPTEIGFFINGYFESGDKLVNIQLLEGTYTSETIPEYQPYFLNRPAHQFTNGQFVDIPTHHFTNGRWQGELTSQSPLKFWADGQMLDWRIEGRTSENLWDGTFVDTSVYQISFSLDDEGYMVGSTTNDSRGWGYAASQIKMTLGAGTYALVLQGIPPTQSWSGAMIYTSGGSALANNQNLVNKPVIIMPFTLAQETSIGIMVKVVNGKYRVQLLEGTYTASTIPPYEPYGCVGDWDETAQRYKIPVTVNSVTTNIYIDHQLLDGDSIDFATDQTAIPIATGNNTLSVDTAVQPSKVFVKFEG